MVMKLGTEVRKLSKDFEKSHLNEMRVLSNEMIEEAALKNSRIRAEIAMIGYTLHKMGTKTHIFQHDRWLRIKKKVVESLNKAAFQVENGKDREFEKTIHGIIRDINSMDSHLGNFVQSSYGKAQVKYASTAYSLGLSVSQASALTGADIKKVLEYIGSTKISDREKPELGIEDRLKKIRNAM